nr:leucine-rich repeat protein [Ruminococcus flavefaciens]
MKCVDGEDYSFSDLFKNVTYIGDSAFTGCDKLEIGDLVLGSKVKSIGRSAFMWCDSITSLYIPDTVTYIGSGAFAYCPNIKKAEIHANIDKESRTSGWLYGAKSMEELIVPSFTFVYEDIIGDVFDYGARSIPDGLTKVTVLSGDTIPENAFNDFRNVTDLELPSELISVGQHATHDMIALKNVYYGGPDEIWKGITEHALETENEPLYNAKRVIPAVEEHIYGDANGDGEIDMSDAVLIMQALANPNKYGVNGTDPSHITSEGFKYADTDGNGLTVNDAQRIQLYLLGKLKVLG